ncbi:MAG: DUF5132 domain-containing protein [Oscillatoria princeps RMCB-10]|jgi:hypothetical protein|nr:DUF5132 domain-containing protein [Oscillatoria princeps RMCB-10]
MALKIGNLFEEFGPVGIAAGIGAVVLLPVVAGLGKPIAKAAIKGGIALYDKSKGVFAEAGEVFEDLVAEARAEIAEEQTKAQMDVAVNPPEG